MRDITKMLQDIDLLKFEEIDFLSSYTDSRGRSFKEYQLPKDLTVTPVTGSRARDALTFQDIYQEAHSAPYSPLQAPGYQPTCFLSSGLYGASPWLYGAVRCS